jgi:transposase-like protein
MSVSNTTKRIKEIRRKTRRKFSSEEKIRMVLDGLRGESSIAELRRREGMVLFSRHRAQSTAINVRLLRRNER